MLHPNPEHIPNVLGILLLLFQCRNFSNVNRDLNVRKKYLEMLPTRAKELNLVFMGFIMCVCEKELCLLTVWKVKFIHTFCSLYCSKQSS